MKKETTIYFGSRSCDERVIIEMIANAVRIPQEWLRKYYSAIIGRDLTKRQASLITRTQLALISVVVLAGQSPLLGIGATAWLVASLIKCKKEIR